MPSTYDEVHAFQWYKGKDDFRILQSRQEFRGVSVPIKTQNNEEATVRLDINLHVKDIEGLIDGTSSLPLTVSKGLAADLVTVGSTLSYTDIRSTISRLVASPSASFPILNSKLDEAGCALESVIFLGFDASEALLKKYQDAEASDQRLAESDATEKRDRDLGLSRQRAELEKVSECEERGQGESVRS